MAAASCVLSEEQFRCSICLDIFTDPVSIPCGHNFCKNCITENWNVNAQCECPLCKKVFTTRPELHINTFISEMAAQFRHSAAKKPRRCSLQKSSSSGDVLCGVCSETKVKAVKSCLMCLASYCEDHLDVHQKFFGPTKHELIDPVMNLADRMCEGHGRPLEMFCKTDQTCVCLSCTESNHKLHSIVPLVEQYEEKKADLKETEAEIQKMIQERHLKIEEIKESVKLSRVDADKKKSDSEEVFTALIRSVEEGLAQLLDLIEEKHKENERQAEGFIQELEDEINVLIKRGTEVEQASTFEDHLQFLQNFLSMNPAPTTKVWTNVKVHSTHHVTVREAVTKMKKTFCEEVEKQRQSELKMMKQYAEDITLDPYTAHPRLRLSYNRKKVGYDNDERTVFDKSCRFTSSVAVLGNKGVSSGKFYFEVLVKHFSNWSLGVAPGSLNMSQKVSPCSETGPWVLELRKRPYSSYRQWSPSLFLESNPDKIGVFVDYEEGRVSFYNENTGEHMYSFTGCKFTGTLYPFLDLSSADNGDHLVMTTVQKT